MPFKWKYNQNYKRYETGRKNLELVLCSNKQLPQIPHMYGQFSVSSPFLFSQTKHHVKWPMFYIVKSFTQPEANAGEYGFAAVLIQGKSSMIVVQNS